MADGENIGGVNVSVTADISELEDQLSKAITVAQDASGKIASAIESGAQQGAQGFQAAMADLVAQGATADEAFQKLTGSVQTFMEALQSGTLADFEDNFGKIGQQAGDAADGLQKFSSSAQDLIDYQAKLDGELAQSISTLGEIHDAFVAGAVSADVLAKAEADVEAAIKAAGSAVQNASVQTKQYSDAAQAIIDTQKRLDDELKVAQGALSEIQSAFTAGAVGARELATAASQVSDAFQTANPQIKEASDNAETASERFSSFATEALKLAGITLSIEALKELALAAIDASDKLDDAAYAIGRFNGSAEAGKVAIDGLRAVAQDEGLSFSTLVTAAQRMSALGVSAQDSVDILAKLGNSAELTGDSIETLAKKFTNIVDGTSLSTKALQGMGLTIGDIDKAMADMNASAEVLAVGAKKAWSSLDGSEKAAIMEQALTKLDGAAKTMNDDVKGDVTRTMNDFYATMAKLGDVIAPLARQALPYLVDAIKVLVTSVDAGVTSFKILIDVVTAYAKILGTAYSAVAEAAIDVSKADFSGAASAITGAIGKIKDTMGGLKDQIQSDFKAGMDFAEQVWNVSIPASVASGAKKVDLSLVQLKNSHKDLADSIEAAFAKVDELESKISSGAGVTELQHAFENTQKAIDTVAKESLPAAIKAVDDYTDAQGRNHAGAEVFLQAFQEQSKLIQQLAKADLPAASQAWTDFIGKLDNAKAPLGVIQASLEQEEKILSQLAKEDFNAAEAGWQKLLRVLQDTNAPLVVLNKALQDHQKFLADTAAAADKAEASFNKLAASYANIATHSPEVTQAFKDAYDTLNKLGLLLPQLPQPMSDLNKAMSDFGLAVQKAKTPVEDLKTPIEQLTADLGKLMDAAKNSGDWSAVNAALDGFDKRIQNLAKTDLPEAAKQMEAWIQSMIDHGAPADLVVGQLSKLEPILKKMASEDLPGASAAWKGYLELLKQIPGAVQSIQQAQEQQLAKDKEILAVMTARGDAYGYILDQQAKVYQEEINLAEKTGDDATNWVLGLEKVRLKQEELKLSATGVADEYVKMIGDILKGFDQIGAAMADAIVNGKNLGDALVGQFKKIAQSILGDLIQAALVPLKIALMELIGGILPSMTGALGAVGGGLGAVNTSAGAAAQGLTALAESANAAAASITASVNGAAGGGMGAGGGGDEGDGSAGSGGIGDMVGNISAVVSAGAAVASAILLGHISSDTGHIEVNTRSTLAEVGNVRSDLWSQFGQMYDRLGEVMNAVNRVVDAVGKLSVSTAGLGPEDSGNLKQIAVNAPYLLTELQAIHSNTNSLDSWLREVDTAVSTGFGDVANWLGIVNQSVLQVVSALLYGGHSPQSMSASEQATSEDIADQTSAIVESGAESAHAIMRSIQDGALDTSNAIGAATSNSNTYAQGMIDRMNDLIAAGTAAAQGAKSQADQLAAMRSEYAELQTLQQVAIQGGQVDLANTISTKMQVLGNDILTLTGHVDDVTTSANSIFNATVAGADQASFAAQGAGTLVAAHVDANAVTVASAVINNTQQSAAYFGQLASTLISVAGSWGATGGGTRTGQNGTTGGTSSQLPNGSGGATVGTAQYGPASNANPGIPVGQQPSFGAVDPSTGKPISNTPPNYDWTPNVGPAPKAPIIATSVPDSTTPNVTSTDVYTSTPGTAGTSGTKNTSGLPGIEVAKISPSDVQIPTGAFAPNTAPDKNAQGPPGGGASFDPVAAAAATGEGVWEALQGHYDAVGAVIKQEAAARLAANGGNTGETYNSTAGSASISGNSGPSAPAGYTANTLPKAMQDAATAASSSAIAANRQAELQAELNVAQKAMADATATGDQQKIALAQAQLQSIEKLIAVSVNAQSAQLQSAADALKQSALQRQLADAQKALNDANKSGNQEAISQAQSHLNDIQQLIVDFLATQKSTTASGSGATLPNTSTGTSGDGITASAQNVFDEETLSFYRGALAEFEDIRNTVHAQRDLLSSMRDSWVAFQTTSIQGAASIVQAIWQSVAHIPGVDASKLPQFDVGGPVARDMMAMIHANEFIIPASGSVSLPADVLARISNLNVTADVGRSANYPTYAGGGNINPATSNTWAPNITIVSNNPRDVAQEVARYLKTASSKMTGAYSS